MQIFYCVYVLTQIIKLNKILHQYLLMHITYSPFQPQMWFKLFYIVISAYKKSLWQFSENDKMSRPIQILQKSSADLEKDCLTLGHFRYRSKCDNKLTEAYNIWTSKFFEEDFFCSLFDFLQYVNIFACDSFRRNYFISENGNCSRRAIPSEVEWLSFQLDQMFPWSQGQWWDAGCEYHFRWSDFQSSQIGIICLFANVQNNAQKGQRTSIFATYR